MELKIDTVSDALAEQFYNYLARVHLIDWMDVAIIYTDTVEYKPLPKPFLTVLERLKLQPKEYSM
jgi:FMN phosphatase YigB (HAD superfamily)